MCQFLADQLLNIMKEKDPYHIREFLEDWRTQTAFLYCTAYKATSDHLMASLSTASVFYILSVAKKKSLGVREGSNGESRTKKTILSTRRRTKEALRKLVKKNVPKC